MYYRVKGTKLRVLGSMHEFPVENQNMPKWVWDGFIWCEGLFMEGNGDVLGTVGLLDSMDKFTLQQKLPRELWSGLIRFWPPENDALTAKTWVTMAVHDRIMGAVYHGVEWQFKERHRLKPKRFLDYLETNEEMAAIVETVPEQDYIDALRFALANETALREAFLKGYQAWIAGRTEEVYQYAQTEPGYRFPRIWDAWSCARSRNWMNRIRLLFGSPNKSLLVVGAGHLWGTGGLQQLFADEKHPLIPLLPNP
jgi:ribosome modulation factor